MASEETTMMRRSYTASEETTSSEETTCNSEELLDLNEVMTLDGIVDHGTKLNVSLKSDANNNDDEDENNNDSGVVAELKLKEGEDPFKDVLEDKLHQNQKYISENTGIQPFDTESSTPPKELVLVEKANEENRFVYNLFIMVFLQVMSKMILKRMKKKKKKKLQILKDLSC